MGAGEGADNALSVWWLFCRTGEKWLLDLLALLREQTLDWESYLTTNLITGPAKVFRHRDHGPNVAMGLKAGAVWSLLDGDRDGHRELTECSLAELERWHGQAHGWFSGDEWIGGREAIAGIETCQVIEAMFTFERLAQIYGGGAYGDALESLAFNLLPASSDPRMLAHQYVQQANQVKVSVGRRNWTMSGDDTNLFGFEPHFGCCTANLHQGWPKFVRSLWMTDPDGGLRAIAYAPCTVDAGPLRLEVSTSYPFEETIRIHVATDMPTRVPLRLRIPAWASDPTLSVAGTPVEVAATDGYLEVDREWRDGDVVELILPMLPFAVRRERQAVGLRMGPLVLVLRIGENWVPVGGAPGLGEWEVHPRSSWNYALAEVSSVADWPVSRSPVGEIPFELASAPITVHGKGAHARGWVMNGEEAAALPDSPVLDAGPVLDITLVPYGSARLRVTEFPTLHEPDKT